jgi:hypothetical protein
MNKNLKQRMMNNLSDLKNEKIELFLTAFMYELEENLNKNLKFFDGLVLHMDEANTDQILKEKIRDFILKYKTKVKNIKEVIVGSQVYPLSYNCKICNVKISSEMDDKEKEYIRNQRNGVYTNPDLLLFVTVGSKTELIPIEVKSTLNDKIPGSSIQQIEPEDWVIFCKHNKSSITEFATGKYISSINGTMQFPDRSPRPQVEFSLLKSWNSHYRFANEDRLDIGIDDSKNDKVQLLNDWQEVLSLRWLEVLKNGETLKKEPWFNNNIRKFAIKLIDYYENLDISEKQNFKKVIEENIKDIDK